MAEKHQLASHAQSPCPLCNGTDLSTVLQLLQEDAAQSAGGISSTDDLRRRLHRYNISVPPNSAADKLESLALCILQFATSSYCTRSFDEVLLHAFDADTDDAIRFETDLCRIRQRMGERGQSAVDVIGDVVMLVNNWCGCNMVSNRVSKCPNIISLADGKTSYIWSYPGDGLFYTVANRTQMFEQLEDYGEALVEDLSADKWLLSRVVDKLNDIETADVLQEVSNFIQQFMGLESLKATCDAVVGPDTLLDNTHPLSRLVCLESQNTLDRQGINKLAVSLKNELLGCIKAAVIEIVLERRKKAELEQQRQKREWNRFLSDVSKYQPDVRSLKDLVKNQKSFNCSKVRQLAFRVIKRLSLEDKWPTDGCADFWSRVDSNQEDDRKMLLTLVTRLFCQQPDIKPNVDDPRIIEVKARYIVLSDVWTKLEKEMQLSEVLEVRLAAAEKIFVDCSIEKPGLNVAMIAPFIDIDDANTFTVDTSGADGQSLDGQKAANACRPGENGNNGRDGKPGQSAGNIYVEALRKFRNVDSLQLIANGGHGSNAEDGGDGSDGKTGHDGIDGNAKQPTGSEYICEEKGSKGETGSPGGHGGDAGRGGRGGSDGEVVISENGSDISLSCLADIEKEPGRNGSDGKPGKGGRGGLGGRKGVDSIWAWHRTECCFGWAWNRFSGEWCHRKGEYTKTEQGGILGTTGYTITMIKNEDDVHAIKSSKGKDGRKGEQASHVSRKIDESPVNRAIDADAMHGIARDVARVFYSSETARGDTVDETDADLSSSTEASKTDLVQMTTGVLEQWRLSMFKGKLLAKKANRHGSKQRKAGKMWSLVKQRIAEGTFKSKETAALELVSEKEIYLAEQRQQLETTQIEKEMLVRQSSKTSQQLKGVKDEISALDTLETGIEQEVMKHMKSTQTQSRVKRLQKFRSEKTSTVEQNVTETVQKCGKAPLDKDDEFVLTTLQTLSQVDVELSNSLESCVQRACLVIPLSTVSECLRNIMPRFVEKLKSDPCFAKSFVVRQYLSDGLLSDVVLAELYASENVDALLKHINICIGIDLQSYRLFEAMFRFRFSTVDDADKLKHAEKWLLDEISSEKVSYTGLLAHVYSSLRDHYVMCYANIFLKHQDASGLRTTDAFDDICKALIHISTIVFDLQQYKQLTLHEAFNEYCRVGIESTDKLLRFLAPLPGLGMTETTAQGLYCAMCIYRNIHLTEEQMDNCRRALMSFKYKRLTQGAGDPELMSAINDFLQLVTETYQQKSVDVMFDIFKRKLLEKNATLVVTQSLAKLERLLLSENNALSFVEKSKFIQQILETTAPESVVNEKLSKLHDELRTAASTLPQVAPMDKVKSATEAFNKNQRTNDLKKVLKTLHEVQSDILSAKCSDSDSLSWSFPLFEQQKKDSLISKIPFGGGKDSRHEQSYQLYLLLEYSDRASIFCQNTELSAVEISDLSKLIAGIDERVLPNRNHLINIVNGSYLANMRTACDSIKLQMDARYDMGDRLQEEIEGQWKGVIDRSHNMLEPSKVYDRMRCMLRAVCLLMETRTMSDAPSPDEYLKDPAKLAKKGDLEKSEESLKTLAILQIKSEFDLGELDRAENMLENVEGIITRCTSIFEKVRKGKASTDDIVPSIDKVLHIAAHQFWERDQSNCEKLQAKLITKAEQLIVDCRHAPDSIVSRIRLLMGLVSAFIADDKSAAIDIITAKLNASRADREDQFKSLGTSLYSDLAFIMKNWSNEVMCVEAVAWFVDDVKKSILTNWSRLSDIEIRQRRRTSLLKALRIKLKSATQRNLDKIMGPFFPDKDTDKCPLSLKSLREVNRYIESYLGRNIDHLKGTTVDALCDVQRVLIVDLDELLISTLASTLPSLEVRRVYDELCNRVEQLAGVLPTQHRELEKLLFKFQLLSQLADAESHMFDKSQQPLDCRHLIRECLKRVDCFVNVQKNPANIDIYKSIAIALYSTSLSVAELNYCDRLLSDTTGIVQSALGKREDACVKLLQEIHIRPAGDRSDNWLIAQLDVFVFTAEENELRLYLEKYEINHKTCGKDLVRMIVLNKSPMQWRSSFVRALLDVVLQTLLVNTDSERYLESLIVDFSESEQADLVSQYRNLTETHKTSRSDESKVKAFISTINQDIDTSSTKQFLSELLKLKTALSRAHFFAVQSRSELVWFEWVHMMCTGLQSCRQLTPSDLTVIFDRSIYAQSENMLGIVCESLPRNWPLRVLCAVIVTHFRTREPQCLPSDILKLQQILITLPSACSSLLEVLLDKLISDSQLPEVKSASVEISDVTQLLQDIAPLNCDDYSRLQTEPLFLWQTTIREIHLLREWKSSSVVNHVLKLDNVVGREAADSFLNSFKPKDSELLLQICELLRRNPWTMNADVLKKLADLKQGKWLRALEKHAKFAQCNSSLAELLSIMRDDPCNDKISHLLGKADSSPMKKYVDSIRNQITEFKNWTEVDVENWASKYRKSHDKEEGITEKRLTAIAVICHAIKLITARSAEGHGFHPRDTQLLTVLTFLDATRYGRAKGRLGEIATGEGKTYTIALFVILTVLDGDSVAVDVISSSSVLAAEGAKEVSELFLMFDITVGNNCDEACEKDEEVRTERYNRDVIYGDLGSFQRDLLLSDFFQKRITRGRTSECIIVDEVDSMLLDKSVNVLYLSHDIPDFKHFNMVFVEIWQAVHAPDVAMGGERDVAQVVKYIKEKMKVADISLPNYLKPVAERHLVLWVKNAFVAKNFVRANDSYILADVSGKGMQVVVMDKDTGVEQIQMQLSHGLHQFLQLKHGDNLHAESLKAVFMSNLGYFEQFKGKIFGVSGTLGSTAERLLVSEVYNLETFNVPRFRTRYCTEKDASITKTAEDWLAAITASVREESDGQRAILIICENVDAVDAIQAALANDRSAHSCNRKIFVYKSAFDNEFHRQNTTHPLSPGQVIVATNLAGRGTDLKISDTVEEHGGLHVIISFMPGNVRTEMQAQGRTARAGKRGSFQFVIISNESRRIEELKRSRDETECSRLNTIRQTDFQRLKIEERLFARFLELFEEVRDKLNEQVLQEGEDAGLLTRLGRWISLLSQLDFKQYNSLQLEFLLNRWALWLDTIDGQLDRLQADTDSILSSAFSEFKAQVSKTVNQNREVKLAESPSELIKLGRFFERENQFSLAIQCLTKSIDIQPQHSAIAHYYRAACYLRQSYNHEAKMLAVADLRKSRQMLLKQASTLATSSEMLKLTTNVRQDAGDAVFNSRYEKQVDNESRIIGIHIEAINSAIGRTLDVPFIESLTGISDQAEAAKLFDAIRSQPIICKNFRVTKKLKIDENGVISLCDKSEKRVLELPPLFSCCKRSIIKFLESKADGDLDSRLIEENHLTPIVVTKVDIWELMKKANFIEDEAFEDRLVVSFDNERRFDDLQLPAHVEPYRSVLKKILSKHHNEPYDSEKTLADLLAQAKLAPGLNDADEEHNSDDLEHLLIENEFIVRRSCASASLSSSAVAYAKDVHDRNASAALPVSKPVSDAPRVPSELSDFKEIIDEWLKDVGDTGEKVTRESVPYFESYADACRTLWSWMTSVGVVKECAVNYSVKKSASIAAETWAETVSKCLTDDTTVQKIYKKYHTPVQTDGKNPYPIEAYVTTLTGGLKTAAGELAVLSKIDVKYVDLETYFLSANDFPPEIKDYEAASFSHVFSLSESVSRWSWGAFAVAMFGLAQVAAGIMLAVFSGGLATPFAMFLIGEGVGDMIYAMQAGLTKSFSWKNYGIHKAVSLSISLLTAGVGAWLSRGQQVANAAQAALQVFKTCSMVAVKNFAMSAAFMTLNLAVESLVEKLVSKLIEVFSENIKSGVRNLFSDRFAEMRNLMRDILHAGSKPNDAKNSVEDAFRVVNGNFCSGPRRTQLGTIVSDTAQQSLRTCLGMYSSHLLEKAKMMKASGINLAGNAAQMKQMITSMALLLQSVAGYVKSAYLIVNFAREYVVMAVEMLAQKKHAAEKTTKKPSSSKQDKEAQQEFEVFSSECISSAEKFIGEHVCRELQQHFLLPAMQALARRCMVKIGKIMVSTAKAAMNRLGYGNQLKQLRNVYFHETTDNSAGALDDESSVDPNAPVANSHSGLTVRQFVDVYGQENLAFYKDKSGRIHIEIPDWETYVNSIGNGKKAVHLDLLMTVNVLKRPIKIVDCTADRSFTSNTDSTELIIYPGGQKTEQEPYVLEYTEVSGHGHFTAVINGQRQEIPLDARSTSRNACFFEALACFEHGWKPEDVAKRVREYARSDVSSQFLYENRIQEYSFGLWGGHMDKKMTSKELFNLLENDKLRLSQNSLRYTTSDDLTLEQLAENMQGGYNEDKPIRLVENVNEDSLISLDHRRLVAAASLDDDTQISTRVFKSDDTSEYRPNCNETADDFLKKFRKMPEGGFTIRESKVRGVPEEMKVKKNDQNVNPTVRDTIVNLKQRLRDKQPDKQL